MLRPSYGRLHYDTNYMTNYLKYTFANPLVKAGLVLGVGFGGLADGIILHQILGWHHLVCYTVNCQPASIAQLDVENTQDGYFHLGLWLVIFKAAMLRMGLTGTRHPRMGAAE